MISSVAASSVKRLSLSLSHLPCSRLARLTKSHSGTTSCRLSTSSQWFKGESREDDGHRGVDLAEAASSPSSSSSRLPPTTMAPRRTSFLQRMWSGESKAEQDEAIKMSEEDQAWVEEQNRVDEIIRQEKKDDLRRKRNKSGLSYSDRMRLMGKAPLEGISLETEDFHMTQEYKRNMFGLYGQQGGLSPRVCWPTKEAMAEQREWEEVFYDGLTDVRDRIKLDRQTREALREHAIAREAEFTANLAKMREEMKQWQARIDMRNKYADRERDKREKILADLKQEYGYDLDPNNPHYAEKIAEKEKEYNKREKEEKKKKRAETAALKKKQEEMETTQKEEETADSPSSSRLG